MKYGDRNDLRLMVGYSDELRIRPTNETLLRAIAERSRGMFDPEPERIFEPADRTAQRPTPLWPHLLTAALCLLVLDVALRRIDFRSFQWRLRTFVDPSV